MRLTATAWSVIGMAGVLTFAIRGSFLLGVARLERLPGPVMELLRLIPAAALAALVAPACCDPGVARCCSGRGRWPGWARSPSPSPRATSC